MFERDDFDGDDDWDRRTPLQWGIDFVAIPSVFVAFAAVMMMITIGSMRLSFAMAAEMVAMVR